MISTVLLLLYCAVAPVEVGRGKEVEQEAVYLHREEVWGQDWGQATARATQGTKRSPERPQDSKRTASQRPSQGLAGAKIPWEGQGFTRAQGAGGHSKVERYPESSSER